MRPSTRILVIEDNGPNRALMTYLLGAFGYVTLEAVDGVSGVDAARRERPDLIICDVHLPKLDGYGVVRQLKKEEGLRDVPIVAVTALAMVGDRDRILDTGFDGYIGKPIAPETFVHEIERFLRPDLRSSLRPGIRTSARRDTPDSGGSNGARGTVLVVDDVPENIEFLRSTLQPSGFAVIAATNVESALGLARETRPDLVLCDLHMAPHGGLDMLERAKTEPALLAIPVAIISSTATGTQDAAECFARGAANFIIRPIEPEALLAEIAKTLGKSGKR